MGYEEERGMEGSNPSDLELSPCHCGRKKTRARLKQLLQGNPKTYLELH